MVKASIIIPILDGGTLLQQTVQAVFNQNADYPFELILIDSESKDGSPEVLEHLPIVWLHTTRAEFNHGETRRQAAARASGEFLVFLTQDAQPSGEHWLDSLLAPFADPAVAGVYARVLPRPDASPLVVRKVEADLVFGTKRLVKRIEDRAAWERMHPFEKRIFAHFNNVCSAIRTAVFREIPFRRIDFGEDLDWGLRALEAGHALVFEPDACVLHSHPTRLREDFERYRADARLMLERLGFVNRTSAWAAIRAAGGEILRDWRFLLQRCSLEDLLRYAPVSPILRLTQTLGQLAGSRAVVRAVRHGNPPPD